MKRKLSLLLALLLFLCLLPERGVKAETGYVRVRLSVGEVSRLTVNVNGSYVLTESGTALTGGTLRISGNGSTVTAEHDTLGVLYSGTTVTLHRTDPTRYGGTLRFAVSNTHRNYLGDITVTASDNRLQVINRVPLSHYLYGVVAYEMSNSFPSEALKAQAVAAKNYVLARMDNNAAYDIGDTSSDQVYKGYNSANTNAILAVDATMHSVLTLPSGALMTCYYSASNGGYMDLPGSHWEKAAYLDEGYSLGPDEYDMQNEASPREDLLLPCAFTKETVQNAVLYRLLNEKLLGTLGLDAESNVRILSVTDAVSMNEAGSTEGLNHTLAKISVLYGPVDAEEASWPEETEPAEKTDAGGTETAGQSEEEPESPSAAIELYLIAEDEPEAAALPAPVKQESPALIAQPETENIPEETDPAPESQPGQPEEAGAKQSPVRGTAATFTVTCDELVKAGLYTNTKLRLFYAFSCEEGFVLRHARYGHGVGLSQRGAQQMAASGFSYKAILSHYYGGAVLKEYPYLYPENSAYTLPENAYADAVKGSRQGAESSRQAASLLSSSGPIEISVATEQQESVLRIAGRVRAADTVLYDTAAGKAVSAALPAGLLVTVLGMEENRYEITAPGDLHGYVNCSGLALLEEAPLATGSLSGDNVNLRTGPGTSSASRAKLAKGTGLVVYGRIADWCHVRTEDGLEGYVHSDYVAVQGN